MAIEFDMEEERHEEEFDSFPLPPYIAIDEYAEKIEINLSLNVGSIPTSYADLLTDIHFEERPYVPVRRTKRTYRGKPGIDILVSIFFGTLALATFIRLLTVLRKISRKILDHDLKP